MISITLLHGGRKAANLGGEIKAKVCLRHQLLNDLEEGRKPVLGIMASIPVAHHLKDGRTARLPCKSANRVAGGFRGAVG